jgi:hypothetical protein
MGPGLEAASVQSAWAKPVSPERVLRNEHGHDSQPSCSYTALPGRRSNRFTPPKPVKLFQQRPFLSPQDRNPRVPPPRVHLSDPLWKSGGGDESEDESEPSPRGWRSIDDGLGLNPLAAQQVQWFHSTWPYIQGHRGSTFVIVLPGEVSRDKKNLDGILQDVSLLHGLGCKILLVCGSQSQIDDLLRQKGWCPLFSAALQLCI